MVKGIELKSAWHILRGQPFRLAITVGGMSLSILLMSFLTAVYRGVSDGSVDYIKSSPAQVWVLQSGTTNILRGFSILTAAHGNLLKEFDGIAWVSPILFRLSSLVAGNRSVTVYLTGYVPGEGMGGPQHVSEGRAIRERGEIVLDASCARSNDLVPGDSIRILDRPFRVVGLSNHTNMFVLQYAFVHLEDVRSMFGISDLVSAYLVGVRTKGSAEQMAAAITAEVPGVTAYSYGDFLAGNTREMESGFLPILSVLDILGAFILSVIIGLLMTMSVLEHRVDFSVLRALGASNGFLVRVILLQSTLLGFFSLIIAIPLLPVLVDGVRLIFPTVEAVVVAGDALMVAVSVLGLCFLGAILPLRVLSNVYPAEAFR